MGTLCEFIFVWNLSLPNKKMWFTLKNYLCEIWKINFRYLWEGLASFSWFWPVLDSCGLFCLVVDGFKYLWLVLGACDCFCYIPGMIKKNARLSEVYGNFGKNVPLLKICHTYPAMMKLGRVIPYLK